MNPIPNPTAINRSCALCGSETFSPCYTTEFGPYTHQMGICHRCKLIQVTDADWPSCELPTAEIEYHSLDPRGQSIEQFGRQKNDVSLKTYQERYAPYLKACQGHFPSLDGVSLLEIGCATGHFLEYMGRAGIKSVYGIETSENCLGFLKDVLGIHAWRKIGQIPPDLKFDVICIFEALMFFPNPAELVRMIAGHLKLGGLLIVEHAVNRGPAISFLAKLMNYPHFRTGTRLHWWTHRGGCTLMAPKHVRMLLEKCGFEILRFTNKKSTMPNGSRRSSWLTYLVTTWNGFARWVELISAGRLLFNKSIYVVARLRPSKG